MKRLFVLTLLLACALIASGAEPKPNVIVIMVDDSSVAVMNAALGNGWAPNIKTYLVNQGIFFSKAYVTCSWCCPSRCTFLTGQYTHNHGCWTNTYPYGGVTKLNDANALPVWLNSAGYRVGQVGRPLNGYGLNEDPNNPKDDATYIPPGFHFWRVMSGLNSPGETVYNYRLTEWQQGGSVALVNYGSAPTDYNTDVFAGHALTFLNSTDTRPFFLWFTPTAPHTEGVKLCDLNSGWTGTIRPAPRHVGSTDGLIVPHTAAFNEADVTDKPGWYVGFPLLTVPQQACLDTVFRHQVASIRAVDDAFGAMVAALQANGKWANTVVIFTSDNGYLHGDHRLNAKRWVYEWAIRVPLYIRRVGTQTPLGVIKMVLNNDLAPTIVELAQATAGLTMDGRSLVPLFTPGATWPRNRAFIEAQGDTGPGGGYSAVRTDQAGATTDMLYVKYMPSGAVECYAMVTDPHQLASNPTGPGCSTLAALLPPFATCAGATCRTLEDQ
jgi:N-acetylglucosamine-6-sulfatase